MKVEHLLEMSATKLCPKCNKSMAANHYWYKGGWKCKKAKEDTAAHPAKAVLAAAAPTHSSVQYDREAERMSDRHRDAMAAAQKAEQPTAKKVDRAVIERLIPELGAEVYGDDLDWQISEHNGKMNVNWDYTFKRNTRLGGYQDNANRIKAANARVEKIAGMYPDSVLKVHYVTPETARKSDEWAEGNGESAYSEYEQSLGGGVTFKTA